MAFVTVFVDVVGNSLWLLLELYSLLRKLRIYLGSVVDLSFQESNSKPSNYFHK